MIGSIVRLPLQLVKKIGSKVEQLYARLHRVGMTVSNPTNDAARAILFTLIGSRAEQASLTFKNLSGGSEAAGVYHVAARYQEMSGRQQHQSFVLKHLRNRARREGVVFKALVEKYGSNIAPRLFGVLDDNTGTYLGLEAIQRSTAWPWRNGDVTSSLMHRLGEFHASVSSVETDLADWDYEAELRARATETGERLVQCRNDPDFVTLTRHVPTVERIIDELPRLRQMLTVAGPLRSRPIHGDVHPGNAIVRRGGDPKPVLIDWGRARFGLPLEDVSSMLQSLRFYEPAALQRHDALFKDHLTGMGLDRRISEDLRGAYWAAGASNAFAGALNLHLMVASDTYRPSSKRRASFDAARDWLRIVRRAHAWSF